MFALRSGEARSSPSPSSGCGVAGRNADRGAGGLGAGRCRLPAQGKCRSIRPRPLWCSAAARRSRPRPRGQTRRARPARRPAARCGRPLPGRLAPLIVASGGSRSAPAHPHGFRQAARHGLASDDALEGRDRPHLPLVPRSHHWQSTRVSNSSHGCPRDLRKLPGAP